MTIQERSSLIRSGRGAASRTQGAPEPSLLRPLNPVRRRTEEVVERVAAQIAEGRLEVGAKLPTEQEMMAAMGVSRTVVREAIAALRARGLVKTRQGAGAFVTGSGRQLYEIDPDGLGSIKSVIEVLELRLAVEMEAAAIASERADSAQIKTIRRAADVFGRAIKSDHRAIKEDFNFHYAIAIATGNPRFVGFLEYLGGLIIPRQSIRTFEGKTGRQRSYIERVADEHSAIVDAIAAREPQKARAAMRKHLVNGKERYRRLADAEDVKRT